MDADGSTHDEHAATAVATAAAYDVSAGRSRQLVSVVNDVDDVPRSASSKTQPGCRRPVRPRVGASDATATPFTTRRHRRITRRRWSAPYHGVVPQLTGDS